MQLRYDAGLEARPLETPILVTLFRALGLLCLITTAFSAFIALTNHEAILNIPVAVLIAAGGISGALIPFGIAQVILLVAKIEYNTAAQQDAAILQSLHKIEGELKAARTADVKREA